MTSSKYLLFTLIWFLIESFSTVIINLQVQDDNDNGQEYVTLWWLEKRTINIITRLKLSFSYRQAQLLFSSSSFCIIILPIIFIFIMCCLKRQSVNWSVEFDRLIRWRIKKVNNQNEIIIIIVVVYNQTIFIDIVIGLN